MANAWEGGLICPNLTIASGVPWDNLSVLAPVHERKKCLLPLAHPEAWHLDTSERFSVIERENLVVECFPEPPAQ
jgi:hypothetical protein